MWGFSFWSVKFLKWMLRFCSPVWFVPLIYFVFMFEVLPLGVATIIRLIISILLCLIYLLSSPRPLGCSLLKGWRGIFNLRNGVRQRKRLEDNVKEWTGLKSAKSQRAVENREKWRKLVVKSSVVPRRPSRLRDRWWWWWWFGVFDRFYLFKQSTAAPLFDSSGISTPGTSISESAMLHTVGSQLPVGAPSTLDNLNFSAHTIARSWTKTSEDAGLTQPKVYFWDTKGT